MLVSLRPSKQEQMFETVRRQKHADGGFLQVYEAASTNMLLFLYSHRLLMLHSGKVGNGTFSQSSSDLINL